MFIKDTSKIDLDTLNLCIELGNKLMTQVLPKLDITEDAKAAWVHELTASNQRIAEMRDEGYKDGRKTARSKRDEVIMLMHMQLTQQLVNIMETGNKHGMPKEESS